MCPAVNAAEAAYESHYHEENVAKAPLRVNLIYQYHKKTCRHCIATWKGSSDLEFLMHHLYVFMEPFCPLVYVVFYELDRPCSVSSLLYD